MSEPLAPGQAFIDRSRAYLSADYLPKIRKCVREIDEADLWWRPNPESNSIGNLILHLAGNIRQWVVSGIGGEPDVRERQQEFDAEGGLDRREVMVLLEDALGAVDRVLTGLSPDRLPEHRTIQGREVTVLDALYHAVEHFGMHTGQIIYITKLRTAAQLGFYEIEAGIARPTW